MQCSVLSVNGVDKYLLLFEGGYPSFCASRAVGAEVGHEFLKYNFFLRDGKYALQIYICLLFEPVCGPIVFALRTHVAKVACARAGEGGGCMCLE